MEISIYDLLPKEEQKEYKQKRYTSKFRQTVKEEYVGGRGDYRTMGQAKVPVPTTDNFLKKHEKEAVLPKKEKFTYPDEDRRRPPVPERTDQPLMGLKTTKNFITTNAVENITSVPKKPEKKFADTRNGDTHNLIPSGLEPVFVHKKDFGETPHYLIKRREEMQRAQEEYDAYIAEHFRRGALRCLTVDERRSIIDGLKANWEDIHEQYQGLSVVTDTTPKKNRKERMEAQMKQLEKDIELFEKFNTIYIGN
ncbi:enkurin-like [Babylonia areolata]|uniref:enkurin-like n=1 Tax=Babylonia areolata TaxID=304850 RepID=UPI003FD05AE0